MCAPASPPAPGELLTDRLRLRRWRAEDREPFAALNADPDVMELMPGPLTRAQSDDLADRIEARFDEEGFGLWAVEVRRDVAAPDDPLAGRFVGFTGLWWAAFEAHFTPAVEVGWRLARAAWGRGHATEAARAAIADGFGRLGLSEIVSFTSVINERSWRVMEKLGMAHDPADDFDHPSLPPGHRLERHVLYRIRPG